MTNLTSKDGLLAFANKRYKEVTHPRYGTFRIQSISEGAWGRIQARVAMAEKKDLHKRYAEMGALLIAESLVNEKGNQYFSGTDRDIAQIQGLDSSLTIWLKSQIEDHCAVKIEEEQNTEEIEEELKKTNDSSSPTVSLGKSVA